MWNRKAIEEEEAEEAMFNRLSEPRYEGVQMQVKYLTKQDAINYLVKVKAIFLYKKDKYKQLISTLHDFYLQRIDADILIERARVLLEGQEELILGFYKFLPAGHEMQIEVEPKIEKTEQESALYFLGKIKASFGVESKAYKDFLAVMLAFKRDNTNTSDVISEVARIFEGRPDLIEDFKQFHSW